MKRAFSAHPRRAGTWRAAAQTTATRRRPRRDPVRARESSPTFESPRIAFTFDYPKDFVAEKRPREQVLARVAVERGSRLNAIKVRRTARRALAPALPRRLQARLRARRSARSTTREERIGDLDTGVLVESRAGGDDEFTSSSYFFTGAGQTWQLECIADAEHRAEIDAACRTALESVDFAR